MTNRLPFLLALALVVAAFAFHPLAAFAQTTKLSELVTPAAPAA